MFSLGEGGDIFSLLLLGIVVSIVGLFIAFWIFIGPTILLIFFVLHVRDHNRVMRRRRKCIYTEELRLHGRNYIVVGLDKKSNYIIEDYKDRRETISWTMNYALRDVSDKKRAEELRLRYGQEGIKEA